MLSGLARLYLLYLLIKQSCLQFSWSFGQIIASYKISCPNMVNHQTKQKRGWEGTNTIFHSNNLHTTPKNIKYEKTYVFFGPTEWSGTPRMFNSRKPVFVEAHWHATCWEPTPCDLFLPAFWFVIHHFRFVYFWASQDLWLSPAPKPWSDAKARAHKY